MDKIIIKDELKQNITILPNEFIDHHMVRADGEYVKIYLLLLRLMGSNLPISVDQLADKLELTHKDILRALKYWEKEGLIHLGEGQETKQSASSDSKASSEMSGSAAVQPDPKNLTKTMAMEKSKGSDVPAKPKAEGSTRHFANDNISAGNAAAYGAIRQVPEKSSLKPIEMDKSIKGTDLEQTVYMAETYLGRPLSASELNSFCYINGQLQFSSDLLEYLIEYCITRGKKSVRYIESVAISWYQQEITTVKQAKEQSAMYTQNVFPIMKAFGISNRNPGSSELDYIKKWNALGLETDIIVEACNRTLLTTHQASFPYANRILEDWKKSGVKTSSDIKSLDKKFHGGTSSPQQKTAQTNCAPANPFHNFEQRSYDYDDLESRLLHKNSQ